MISLPLSPPPTYLSGGECVGGLPDGGGDPVHLQVCSADDADQQRGGAERAAGEQRLHPQGR